MTPLRSTDAKVIERTRRWQRRRRPVGAIFLVLGLAAVALVLYWVHDLRAQSLALLAQFNPARSPTTQQMQRTFDHAQYDMGLGVGFVLAAALSVGASLATSGLVWLFTPNRKDRLLLRCWDNQDAATTVDR
jgi:hypothetical protein